ncbi:MAG: transglycosylase SLT domain-containing protein [Myxococcales bacterium]|nr:transglycosylase SLT domain-containing protein [Myxococcales bacterium]
MSKRVVLVGILAWAACSGDDAQRHRTSLIPGPVAADATADASVAVDAPPPGPPVAALTEDMGQPYFAGTPAVAALAREDWAAAATGFSALALSATDPDERGRALLLAGTALAEQSKWGLAADAFAGARALVPALADYLSYHEARARFFAHDGATALALARAVSPDAIVGADAELLVGDLLRGAGDAKAVADHYRGYLARRPQGIRRAEARFRQAEALEGAGDTTGEAATLYRAITIDDPLSSWATKATARLDARTKAGGPPPPPLTATERLTRAKALFDGQRNAESEAAYAEVLAAPDRTPADTCVASYQRAQSLFKARDRKAAAPAFDQAVTACMAADDKDTLVRAYYQAGRSYAYNRDHAAAIARYRAAGDADPTHSYADDALLRAAEEYADLGDDAQVTAALEALPQKFPAGDMRAEALWRLGWRAFRANDDERAIGYWQDQIAAVPIDDNYWAEGQPQYWIGRAELRRGRRAEALASWAQAVRLYPVTYYAMLALNRIRELDAPRFEALMAELTRDPAGYDPAAPAFQFQPRAAYATPAFGRAVEFIRLGLGDPAEAELRAIGLAPPTDKKRIDDPDRIEQLWALAWLYDRAGRYGSSHWPTRWHILEYKRAWPVGANRARWRIAYPPAFYDLLKRHADLNGAPVALAQGIVREESAFTPTLESYANAIGLTQMINSTATRFAKGTGIAPTRENLKDPEKNVTIGARFLGYLVGHWGGFIHLVPPSYNAGEGAVKRWLKVRGTWPADEFIEAIVDDQARNYSKRVLGSYFVYTWLAGGGVPPMPNQIPPAILPAP